MMLLQPTTALKPTILCFIPPSLEKNRSPQSHHEPYTFGHKENSKRILISELMLEFFHVTL